jgi:polysaccharide biosynthesis transport protein
MSDTNPNGANQNTNGAPAPAGKNALVPAAGLPPASVNLRTMLTRRPDPETTGSGRIVWDAVRRWGKWAIPAGIVLGIAAGVVAYLLFTPQYEAVAVIQIDELPAALAFDSRTEGAQSKAYVQTQIELLRQSKVIAPILANGEIASIPEIAKQDDPVRWLSRQIKVKQVGQSEFYTVSF